MEKMKKQENDSFVWHSQKPFKREFPKDSEGILNNVKKRMLVFGVILLSCFFQGSLMAQDPVNYSSTDGNPAYQAGLIYLKLKDNSKIELMDGSIVVSQEEKDLIAILDRYGVSRYEKPFTDLQDPIFKRTYRITFSDQGNIESLLKEVQSIADVDYAEKVPAMYSQATPNDPTIPYYWNLINANGATNIHTSAGGARVAIVDDAVSTTHQDLAANNSGINRDVSDLDNDPNPPASGATAANGNNFSHGTHVAGIAAGVTNNGIGMASIGWNLSVMGVKCRSNFNTQVGAITHGYDGIAWAAANGADVINMSWGGTGFSQTEYNVVVAAKNMDVVLIASAGNNYTLNASYPAAYGEGATAQSWEIYDKKLVVAVASLDANNDISLWGINGFGQQTGSNSGFWVDISSYGTGIYSAIANSSGGLAINNQYGLKNGTSMAAPIVAGVAGLMRSYNSSKTANEIIDCLLFTANPDIYNGTAHPLNVPGMLGTGRVDAEAALRCLGVGCNNPIAVIIPSAPTICPNSTVNLTANQGIAYQWSTGATTQAITITSPGTYTVTVTFTGGCTATQSITIPAADTQAHIIITENSGLFPNDGILCGQDMLQLSSYYGLSYYWNSFGGVYTPAIPGTINAGGNSNLPFKWSISVTITGVGGCPGLVSTATAEIQWLLPPTVTATASANPICAGQPVTLTAAGANTYVWNPGNIAGNPITVTPPSNTTYTVTGTDLFGCQGTATVPIQVLQNQINIGLSASITTICPGQSAIITPSGATGSYTVQPGNITVSNGSSFTVSPTTTTTYTVTGSNGICSGSSQITINVEPCNPDCSVIADFSYTTDNCTLNFTDLSTTTGSLTGWYWQLTDLSTGTIVSTSTTQNPSFTVPASGVYEICFVVDASNGQSACQDKLCKKFEIVCKPCEVFPKFDYKLENCTAYFTDYSYATGTIYAWNWEYFDAFGNSIGTSTLQNPSFTFPASGTYKVCLTVTASTATEKCKETLCIEIKVDCVPPCEVTPKFDYKLENCTAYFTDYSYATGTIYAWNWEYFDAFGNSIGTSTLQNPSFTFPASGTYKVCLTVTASTANDKCKETLCIEINVDCVPPCEVTPKFDYKFENCTAYFTDYSVANGTIYAWSWQFYDAFGNSIGTSTLQNPSFTFPASGTYKVCLVVYATTGLQKCKELLCIEINVDCKPCDIKADFKYQVKKCKVQFGDVSSSAAAIVSWQWDFGDGTGSSAQNPLHIFPGSGTYHVCLTVVSIQNGMECKDTKCYDITLTCPSQPCTVTAAFNVSGLSGSKTRNFNDNSTTSGTITGWAWTFGDGGTSTLQNPTHTYVSFGTYTVCLTVTAVLNGQVCTNQICKTIKVKPGIFNPNILPNKMTAFPNPTSQDATISLEAAQDATAVVEIYNMYGEMISEIYRGNLEAGVAKELKWDASSVTPGVYLIKANINGEVLQERLVVTK